MIDTNMVNIYDLLYSTTMAPTQEVIDYVIEQLKLCENLDTDEKIVLNEYLALTKDTKGTPSSMTLINKNIAYSTAKTIVEDCLEDNVNIFVANKDRMKKASILTNAAMEITKPDADIDAVAENIFKLFDKNSNDEDNYINPYNIEEKLKELHEKPEINGIKYGINFIDEIYPGTAPGSLTVIAGYTGSMKTTLAVNHCFTHMIEGKNVLYFSLEVSEEDLILNLMSLYTMSYTAEPITRDKIKKMKNTEKEKFDRIYTELMSLPGKIVIRDERTIGESSQKNYNSIIHKVDKDFKENTSRGLDLIVVDHAQLLKYDTNTKGNRDPYQILNMWTDFFRKYASRDNFAVIIVSQTSRGGFEYANRHGGQYLLTGLAEGNELERGATCVITLFSSDESKASGEISIQVLKNRYGPTMLEPQTVIVRPEYYMIGSGYKNQTKQVEAVFTDTDVPINPFDSMENVSLDSILSGM